MGKHSSKSWKVNLALFIAALIFYLVIKFIQVHHL